MKKVLRQSIGAIALSGLIITCMQASAKDVALSAEASENETLTQKMTFQLPKLYGTMEHPKIVDITDNNNAGMRSVFLDNGDHLIFNEDAETVVINIRGNMNVIDLAQGVNLTEGTRIKQVERIFEQYKPMYTVPAVGKEKAHIYIAKDPQCGYCSKLEGEVPKLTKAGIAVSMYPLAVFPGSMKAMELTGCSASPKEAYETFAANIRGLKSSVESKAEEMGVDLVSRDSESVVMDALVADFAKAEDLYTEDCEYPAEAITRGFNAASLSGTPAIFTDKGQLIRGYISADRIIDAVK